MEKMLDERYKIDELADAAGGYFAMPSADELAYTELLFDVCDQFGIHYYSADKKARAFLARSPDDPDHGAASPKAVRQRTLFSCRERKYISSQLQWIASESGNGKDRK